MVSTIVMYALAAASLLSLSSAQSSSTVVSIPTPTASVTPNAMTDIGCFDTGVPLEDHGSYIFQSQGNCQSICVLLQKPVLGLVDGSNCWCGDLLPPKAAQVDNNTCNTPCNGIDTDLCGGNQKWWISLSGLNHNSIANYDPSSASSSATTAATPIVTAGPSTVVVTQSDAAQTAKPTSSTPESSGPNKAGIAAGVVVGVVALAAIIAAVVFFLKNKRRRAVEEEYRRQAAVNQFVAGGKLHTSNSSMNDSRLDPEVMGRRQSSGSIADNEDYSRRILKVTNPDGH